MQDVITLTDAFCLENLNEKYAELCRQPAEELARQQPSPLLRGRLTSWASGTVRTIGFVNFLGASDRERCLKIKEIDGPFGIAQSTGLAKSREIRNMLDIDWFEPSWTLTSEIGMNPFTWLLEANGMPLDVRYAPREIQEIAFAQGLIRYIPDSRQVEPKQKQKAATRDKQPADDTGIDLV